MFKKVVGKMFSISEDEYSGIVFVEFFEKDFIFLEDIKFFLECVLKNWDGKKKLVFLDLSLVDNMSEEAIQFWAGFEFKKIVKNVAVLISPNGELARTGISFFLNLEKEFFPINIFVDKSKALEYLDEKKVFSKIDFEKK